MSQKYNNRTLVKAYLPNDVASLFEKYKQKNPYVSESVCATILINAGLEAYFNKQETLKRKNASAADEEVRLHEELEKRGQMNLVKQLSGEVKQ